MVKKGGMGSNRNKYNQRGRPNGGGMNDFRNRSQQSNGSFGSANGGQRPASRFSGAPNGQQSYQPRPYGVAGNTNQARTNPSNHLTKSGSYFDGTNGASRTPADQSKFSGFQSKPPSVAQNVYGQQSYSSSMTPSISSMYNLPPPSLQFNSVQSVPYNYPPPVLPVKN